MAIHYPPISALRALEAAARHLSYTRAAEELLGFRLFERRGRRLVLTESGHALVPIVRDFLRRLTSTLEELNEMKDNSPSALRVTLLQSFAFKWLVHRLGGFNHQHPDIDVWISTSEELVDFDSENADVGIRLGYGNWNNLYEELLLTEYVFPVCSPRFLEEHGTPKKPEDLLELPLLRRGTIEILPRWRSWFKDAGVVVKKMPKGTQFPQTSLAIQASIDDQGLTLARSAHVLDDIKAGRLVRLFPEVKSKSNVSYFFVCTMGRENEPQILAFREWLSRESKKSQKEFDDMLD